MILLYLLVSLITGAAVGYSTRNIATGVVGGLFGGLLLYSFGWYRDEWSLALKFSAMLGYMVVAAVCAGILLIVKNKIS